MRGTKILIVDDDKIVLDSCRRVLETESFEISTVSNVDDALERLQREDFVLLIVDVKMPKRDGISLMQEMTEKWPEIPVIAMSGYPTPETIADGARRGAAQFIAKPFTPEELLVSVREVLRLRSNVR